MTSRKPKRDPGNEPFVLTRVRDLDGEVVPGGEVVPNFYVGSQRPGRQFAVIVTSDDDSPFIALYGPFPTKRAASDWAHDHVISKGRGRTPGNRWLVVPIDAAEGA